MRRRSTVSIYWAIEANLDAVTNHLKTKRPLELGGTRRTPSGYGNAFSDREEGAAACWREVECLAKDADSYVIIGIQRGRQRVACDASQRVCTCNVPWG